MVVHALLFCAILTLIPSPYEMARANDQDKMIEVLAKLRNVDAENVINEANNIKKEVEEEKTNVKENIIENLKRMNQSNLKNIVIILTVFSFNHLCGIFVIITYLVDIFSSTGISTFVLVTVRGFSEMIFSFFQLIIADRLGRLRHNFLSLFILINLLFQEDFFTLFWYWHILDNISICCHILEGK